MNALDVAISALKAIVILVAVIQVVPVMIYVERKVAALIQDRPGPNRVGPLGLLQPVADAVKFLFKEDPIPLNTNRLLYTLAPFLSLLPACLVIAALPIADKAVLFGKEITIQIADLDVSLIYVLAIGSLGVYGILFGGWASNNKFSLIGALRSASQMVSYELPLGLATVGAVMVYGTYSLREMVVLQDGTLGGFLPNWGIFYQPLGFLIFLISSFAETNRLPFDLPETEAELVAGFHTEYGSMKFATFFMAEYMNLSTMAGMMTVLFFGGWHLPWITDQQVLDWVGSQNLLCLIQVVTYISKVAVFLFLYVLIRWTLPRFRFDQLLHLAWTNLIPLGLINVAVSAVLMYLMRGPA
ncbi:MAG: NADH-quinone oxidoreductase subunit NuoH [Proteobacteria bacterium]|nr:NADH-quinone oxidoreductase subunit NuoH [Pseudomonadota bacterium]NDC23511.1 NADH-quinone oxidoreductase subunit NuoH [Pseudomonadota bacterium]NDD03502.1 NADH-quinone oxidoreductase subunit NuoH [Pseudomonadota bacterium]NDG26020.1 NADH-quinone oxidoreductase subunit NuoH [Pseudomonadota bacterium]